MALRADPPDVLDSGSYKIGTSLGKRMAGWALGAVAVLFSIGLAIPLLGRAGSAFSRTTGLPFSVPGVQNSGGQSSRWEGW